MIRSMQILTLLLSITIVMVSRSHGGETSGMLARSFVKPIDLSVFEKRYRSLPPRDQELIRLYLDGARRYVLTREDGVFPDAGTEHWRNIAERAHGAAVLAAMPSDWPEELKARCRREATEFVVSFTAEFNKHNDFGNPWQCSWWAGEMGIAAWFLWDGLEPGVQNNVAEMIAFHADRIAAKEPGAKVNGDTEAETVSWNSCVLSLAVNMMPTHPHRAQWQKATKRYVYTVFGTSADLQDAASGDDGIPIKDWVVGANIHDDYSLENHGRFHMDYVMSAYRFILQGAAMYRVGGNELPKAFAHHIGDVHQQVVQRCLNGSKFAVYVSDNDWKRYHLWTESPAVHGYVALVTSSPLASALEEEALRNASRCWKDFPPGFQYDNPYVCGKAWTPRIADIVLLHLLSPPSSPPLPKDEVEATLQGVCQKQGVRLVSQYSKAGSFRSFYGGPGPVVRHVEPSTEPWMLLPLESNYRITTDPQTRNQDAKMQSASGSNWFWVMRSNAHGSNEAFVSLPDETVVMLTTVSDLALSGVKTLDSHVGIDRPHEAFSIYYEGGTATCPSGQHEWNRTDNAPGLEIASHWVNLADSIGYVVLDLSKTPWNMTLPKPGARGELGLFHAQRTSGKPVQLAMVVFPNQSHTQTRAVWPHVTAAASEELMTCEVPHYFVSANFSDSQTSVTLPGSSASGAATECPPHTTTIWQAADDRRAWSRLK